MTQKEKKAPVKLNIRLDDEIAQGMYVNLTMVNHTETEFALDFIYIQPQEPKAKVRARIIASPRHVKRLITALSDSMTKYEQKFGQVEPDKMPDNLILH